jgi:hypothetical protein
MNSVPVFARPAMLAMVSAHDAESRHLKADRQEAAKRVLRVVARPSSDDIARNAGASR